MSSFLLKVQSWSPAGCPSSTTTPDATTTAEKRRQDAQCHAWVVRLIWVALHVAIIGGLFMVDSNLSWAWRRARVMYFTAYIFLLVTTAAFYVALCLANPGFLQTGVHALSLATRKRESKVLLDPSDAAEMGIGGLAHADVHFGWRASGMQRDKSKIDRTSTLPNLPSQSNTRKTIMDVLDQMSDSPTSTSSDSGKEGLRVAGQQGSGKTQGGKTGETSFEQHAGSEEFSIARQGDYIQYQKGKVRGRGASLGSDKEFALAFASSQEWKDRKGDESAEALLSSSRQESGGAAAGAEDMRSVELERRPSKPASPSVAYRRERPFSWWEGPNPGRWCEHCGAWQLLRSRHCFDCGRCVRRFDHHCTWVGNCIGQENHLLFWWYLAVQLTLLCWTTHIILDSFSFPVALTFGRIAVLLLCLVPSFTTTVFVAMLLAYHTYLVLTAQTTYELMMGQASSSSPAKIAYLRHLPHGAHPFSQGIAQNTVDFCCGASSTTYQMPGALSARRSNM